MPKETPGLIFPLEFTDQNAGYKLADLKETVRFNLKNIILTNPGERVMIPDFGVGIRQALFEFSTADLTADMIGLIDEQISFYAPYVTILDIFAKPISEQKIFVSLQYEIDFAQIVDTLDLEISNI